jgi:Protein of unknown function (DUF2934)
MQQTEDRMPQHQDDREQKLRKSAYRLWVQAGRPQGREEEYRRLAKARLAEDENQVSNDDRPKAKATPQRH